MAASALRADFTLSPTLVCHNSAKKHIVFLELVRLFFLKVLYSAISSVQHMEINILVS